MLWEDPTQLAGFIVHAANGMVPGRENTARLLYRMLQAAWQDPEYRDWSAFQFNSLVWAQERLLLMPPVVWGVGDTLASEKPNEDVRNWLLLPTNTDLDTSSELVQAAKARFNPTHWEELEHRAPATLGQVFLSVRGGVSMDGLVHLVCRNPHDSTLHALEECFGNLPSQIGVQYVLPIWQAQKNLARWAAAIAGWIHGNPEGGLKGRQPFVIRFSKEERSVGESLERLLVGAGVPVGREGDSSAGVDLGLKQSKQLASRLWGLVEAGGPLTPQSFASWLNSGVQMSADAWDRCIAILGEKV